MASETEEKTTANWMKEAQKGYIRIGVLILLARKPAHGYELMKEINHRTKGMWQPTPGGIYPILQDLEKSRYIKGEWQTQKNRRLKVYKITRSGELILKRAILKQSEIFKNIDSLFREFSREVLNIPPTETPMPPMPSVFKPFLDDAESFENLKQLEQERRRTYEAIKNMQKHLKEIDAAIKEIKKQSTPDSPTRGAPSNKGSF